MTEEIKEVIDYKKILIVIGLVSLGIVVLIIINPINITLPTIALPVLTEENKPVTEKTDPIKPEYQKYLDLGISYDDVLDFQDMECTIFNTPEMISTDTKYTAIIEQRKIDCGL